MIDTLTSLPVFGIGLTLGSYFIGQWIHKKCPSPLANPLVIAVAICMGVLTIFHIPLGNYQQGSNIIGLFLAPATAALGLNVYRQFPMLRKNLLPVMAGTAVGSAVSMSSVILLCRLFHLEEIMEKSLLAKSVTTAIAIEITEQQGGIAPITVAAVVITGILGAVLSPFLIRILHIADPVAAGLAIGTASHALGTTKALEIGEIEGAMSSIAIGTAGLMTIIFTLFLHSGINDGYA